MASFYCVPAPSSRAAATGCCSPTTSPTAWPAASALMDALCHRLWVEPGKVSEDGLRQRRRAPRAPACATRGRRCWSTAARSRARRRRASSRSPS
ncbi:MAG: hypothetical protein MZV70_33895 [Desulfobacterales bacterium]|nr:hypothetical protein [Desulfobacterales bacterium]